MSVTLQRFFLAGLLMLSSLTLGAQMIKAPTKVDPNKKKSAKPVVKFNDDEKADSIAAAKKADLSFAHLLLKANKGSAVSVNINNEESGKIRAGMAKKISIDNADSLHIILNDGQGNLLDTAFVVDNKDSGTTITVAFPEIDYAAIRAEEARKIKEAHEEELRKIREAEEALRLQRVGLLNIAETDIRDHIRKTLDTKTSLQDKITRIKNGEIPVTDEVIQTNTNFAAEKTQLKEKLQVYTDSSTAYNMKEQQTNFFKEIKPDHDKILTDSFYTFINAVQSGKLPMSGNVEVAFKVSRAGDIPFFVGKDTLEEARIAGKRILLYAIDAKSDTTVFNYLFNNGVSPENFAGRFPDNSEIYFTPLSYACINADPAIVRVFLERKAHLFPSSLSKIDQKKQVKFLLKKFGQRADIMALLAEYKHDMDDGTAAINAAIGSVDSSMVLVEGGSFSMGCPNELAAGCGSDEKPAINVTVDSFYISKFELNQAIWTAIMDDENPSFFKGCATCPVEMISWDQISEFIKKLNKFSGKNYRLPTEAEWEFAARGGKNGNKEFIYAGSSDVNEVASYKDNSNKTTPGGSKKANELGLFDMSGNVAEWCNDFYAADYFNRSTLVNPKGPDVSAQKVVRGGSFMQSSWSSRLSNREGHEQTFSNNNTGFRLALSINK